MGKLLKGLPLAFGLCIVLAGGVLVERGQTTANDNLVIDGELLIDGAAIQPIKLPEGVTQVEYNLITQLAEDGKICKVYGHAWRWGRPGEGGGVVFADYHPGTEYETCKICGAVKTTTQVETIRE